LAKNYEVLYFFSLVFQKKRANPKNINTMSLEKIKSLRERTGLGIADIKKALEEAEGNEEKAIEILRKKGLKKALKKSEKNTQEGTIASYIHSNNQVGAIVKLLCETDFVARNEEFKTLASDIAMHIVAMNPRYLRVEDVPEKIIEAEKEIWLDQLKAEKKPAEIIPKIIFGKELKFKQEISLLSQSFVKNPEQTVENLIAEKIAKMGENIRVGSFWRTEL